MGRTEDLPDVLKASYTHSIFVLIPSVIFGDLFYCDDYSILKEFDVVNFAYKFKISICFTKLGNYSYLDKILSKSYKYKNFHIFPNHCLFSFDCNNSPSQ